MLFEIFLIENINYIYRKVNKYVNWMTNNHYIIIFLPIFMCMQCVMFSHIHALQLYSFVDFISDLKYVLMRAHIYIMFYNVRCKLDTLHRETNILYWWDDNAPQSVKFCWICESCVTQFCIILVYLHGNLEMGSCVMREVFINHHSVNNWTYMIIFKYKDKTNK